MVTSISARKFGQLLTPHLVDSLNTLDRLSWIPAPTDLILSQSDVHVWQANLDLTSWVINDLRETLSADEQQRAQRYHFERDRRHFIAARGILRTILGRYLGMEPSELQFGYSNQGKPSLNTTSAGGMLQFNLSHSNGLALYAIALGREVGIDLEYIRPIEAEQLAKRFFCPQEYEAICEFSGEKKQEAFFQTWTCKEAYLKATGDGLAGLQEVEISLSDQEPAKLKSISGNPFLASRWSLQPLNPGTGYVGALVVEGRGWHPSCWEFGC